MVSVRCSRLHDGNKITYWHASRSVLPLGSHRSERKTQVLTKGRTIRSYERSDLKFRGGQSQQSCKQGPYFRSIMMWIRSHSNRIINAGIGVDLSNVS
jgi:hypothetical protein